ncbi:MAG: GNAT family N-acetyltransferase [Symploca sp. SIO2E9]|nr:GNAT family N-acetyltransferase [Symploca sp. SIO2E9]
MDWTIHPISSLGRSSSGLRKEQFNSGEPELDKYLKQYALKNDPIITKTFVILAGDNSGKIAGYYACSMSTISPIGLSLEERKRLPKYPVPVMLIGKLAVDSSFQGMGVGKRLLRHAFENAVSLSENVVIYAIRVDALDHKAKKYYLKHGFLELQDSPLSLILPLETIRKAIKLKQG